jgi:hypothetical protein
MLDMPSVFGSKIARFLGAELVSMQLLIKPACEAALGARRLSPVSS